MSLIPTRLLILRRLTALLEEVAYQDEAGNDVLMLGRVSRGRILLGEESKPPLLSVLEAARPDPHTGYAGDENDAHHDMWPLLVQGIIEDDIDNPTDPAYFMVAAVEAQLSKIIAVDANTGHALFPQHKDLGGLITALEIMPPVVRPPEDKVSSKAFFFLPIRLGVAISSDQPYTTV